MIHQYQNNGYNIVLDVNSGAVHVVDQERKARGQIYGGRPEGYSGCGDRADRAGKTLYKGYL